MYIINVFLWYIKILITVRTIQLKIVFYIDLDKTYNYAYYAILNISHFLMVKNFSSDQINTKNIILILKSIFRFISLYFKQIF